MKIVHISDLHLCQSYKKGNIVKIKKLLSHIATLNADHLVITGDISDNANEKDYHILKKNLQAFNLYSTEKTTIIPGNHDIFGGIQKAEDILNFPSKCLKIPYREKVTLFVENFKELFTGTYFPNENEYFPFAKPLNGVVLIGLNTVEKYSRLKNPMASNGKVHKKQFDGLTEILTAKSFGDFRKIILTHHHFYKGCHEVNSSTNAIWNKIEKHTMKLRGKRKLLNTFAGSDVSAVLHGHSHDMKIYERNGIVFLNAGNSIENQSLPGYRLYVVNITKDEPKISIELLTEKDITDKKCTAHIFKTA
jgi:3',5'-cyclic-AMP phosphodiesterase